MFQLIRKTTGLILILGSWLSVTSCATTDAAQEESVYICTGPKAKVYHSTPDCKGLSRCSDTIKKVSKSSTKRKGCRICTEN